MAGQIDFQHVTNFMAEHAGKHVSEMANLSPETLQKAKDMYLASHGRLPSPPPEQPLRPSSQLEAFRKEFRSGIDNFLQRTQDREASAAFATGSSWEGLQQEAAKAWAAYNKHQKRKRNWRRPFEVLDHAAEKVMSSCCIEFLLELMPHGEYSSVLTGGLTLAYHTAVRKVQFREDILGLFDSLSERGKQTKARIRLYSSNPDLRSKSEELYMAVLDCVRHSMTWLDANSAFESFKAFFQQGSYGSELKDARAKMDQKVKEFDETVELCLMRQVSDIRDGVEWLKIPALATFSLLAGFLKDFPAMAADVLRRAQESQSPANYLIQANYMQPALPVATIACWQLRQYLAAEYAGAPNGDNGGLALAELDADATMAMKHIPFLTQREAMGMLTTSPVFVAWLRGVESAFVVVHEGEGVQQQGAALSTLSHLCGLMACTMRAPGLYTLAFFCGLHTAANARLQGGRGVMVALTLQLLRCLGDITFPSPVDPGTVMQRLAAGDLEAICSVFSMALEQVPAGVVFVLIDGAHWNGTEARAAEMRAVVRFLHRTQEQALSARRGLVLKVLISNPSARQRYGWDLATDDLYMERQLFARGHSGAGEEMIADAVSHPAW